MMSEQNGSIPSPDRSTKQENLHVQSSSEVFGSSGNKSSNNTSSSAFTGTTPSSGDTVPETAATQGTQENSDDAVQFQETVWGVMHALQPAFYNLNLTEDKYVFGRGRMCDYSLDVPSIRKTKFFKNYSKEHFCLYRTKKTDGSTDQIFVEDFGGINGTYINGEKIPAKSKWPIKVRDKIAMSNPSNDVFLFIDSENQDAEFHEDFRKKYVVHRLLGTGATGKVHEVWGKLSAGRFAAKVINKARLTAYSLQPSSVHRDIRTEAEILTKLGHPCVIAVHDVIDTARELYIVLEYAGGGELFLRLQNNGALAEATAKLFFYQMLCAVMYLHEHDITHRDLKPENILLMSTADQCRIKITDFGMSRLVGEQSFMQTIAGTPSYLAPEIIQHSRRQSAGYTKLVDLWSLGVVLYVCLVAYPPFSRQRPDTTEDVEEQIVKGNYNFRTGNWLKVSKQAVSLVKSLMQVDPSRRLTSSQAMAHTWLDDRTMLRKASEIMYPERDPDRQVSEMDERKVSSGSTETRKISTDNDDSPAAPGSRLTSVDSNEYQHLLAGENKGSGEFGSKEIEKRTLEMAATEETKPTEGALPAKKFKGL